ncbi:hypothetical protein GPALN_007972 [Globodera pallida]|nr:hypothetical protein GPALN_007972 [Globodera pallida]
MVDNGTAPPPPPPSFRFNVLISSQCHSLNGGSLCKEENLTEDEAAKRRETEGDEEEERGAKSAKKKKPYKELTLEEKVELIRLAERCSNLSQASIAERYAIAKSNVCRILQRKDEYIMALESAGFAGSRKRKLRAVPSGGGLSGGGGSTEGGERAAGGGVNGNCEQQAEARASGGGGEEVAEGMVDMELTEEDGRDSDALRVHMSNEHNIGRAFLCRCCNWAFRDKNALHEHLRGRRTDQTTGEDNNGISLKGEERRNPSPKEGRTGDTMPIPIGDVPSSIGLSLDQLSLANEQNTLMATIWSNILLNQSQLRHHLANGRAAAAATGVEQENMPKTDGGGGPNRPSGQIVDFTFAHHLASAFTSSQAQPSSSSSFLPAMPTGTTVIVQNGVPSSSSSSSSTSSSSSSSSSASSLSSSSFSNNCLIHSSSLPLGSSSFDSDSELSSHSQTISPTHSDRGTRRFVPPTQKQQNVAGGATNFHQNVAQQQAEAQCAHCLVAKPRLLLAQARSSYLEATTVSFQNELLRLNAKCLLAEQCVRRLEMELRQWRERNDFLRFRLLECREKTLEIIAGGGTAGAQTELSKFVGDVLKITLV